MTKETRTIIDWIYRMVPRYGGTVYGYGRTWDWGQALCVEQYGLDFAAWPNAPSAADVTRAFQWERGVWPAWAKREAP